MSCGAFNALAATRAVLAAERPSTGRNAYATKYKGRPSNHIGKIRRQQFGRHYYAFPVAAPDPAPVAAKMRYRMNKNAYATDTGMLRH